MNETRAEFVEQQKRTALIRVNPENRTHIELAHRLDELSDADGLLDENAQPETLPADQFHRWTHAGDSPTNMWRQLDFIVLSDGETSGFVNSYRMNHELLETVLSNRKIVKQLAASGINSTNAKIDEMQSFVPEKYKGEQERSLRQHIASRFNAGTDMIVVWTDEEHRPDELEALRVLGFKDGPKAHYEGERRLSTSHYLDRASFFGAGAHRLEGFVE